MVDVQPLLRREMPCPRCGGEKITGEYDYEVNEYITGPCGVCSGTGNAPESAEVWAERNAGIARVLVRAVDTYYCWTFLLGELPEDSDIDCGGCSYKPAESSACIMARLVAAEKAAEEENEP